MNPRPPLLRLLRRDGMSRVALVAVSVTALLWLVMGFALAPGLGEDAPGFLGGSAVGSVLLVSGCGCWAFFRLLRLRRLLAEGARVTGTVLRVDSLTEGGWHTTVGFRLDGRAYRTVIGTPSRPRYEAGEVVILRADPRRPARAIIESMYAD